MKRPPLPRPRLSQAALKAPRYALASVLLALLLLPPGCQCGGDEAIAPRPPGRLVLSVVYDQVGSDSLTRLYPLLRDDGLIKTLAREGVYIPRARYEHGATLTAPGHVTLYTGRSPREHGIVSNMVIDRETRALSTPLSDPDYPMFGAPDYSAGAEAIRGDSVSLALLESTAGQARVLSVSLKDRSAIPAAVRPQATHAFWYESRASGFTTSSFYGERYPAWFEAFQREHPLAPRLGVWRLSSAELESALLDLGVADESEGEEDWHGLGTTFPHDVAGSERAESVFRATPGATAYQLELVRAGVRALGMGEDEISDLLAISVSATDYAGHIFGPDSWEYADTLVESDRLMGELYRWLARRSRVSVLVTSDHGSPHLPQRAGTGPHLQEGGLMTLLEEHLDAELGPGDWVAGYMDVYVYLTPNALAAGPQVKALARAFLEAQRGVHRVYDVAALVALNAPEDPLDRAVWESVAAGLGGDLYLVPEPQHLFGAGYVHGGIWHGSPWDYDRDVPVLFMGEGVAPARVEQRMSTLQVAPTLCRLLDTRALEGAPMRALPGAP